MQMRGKPDDVQRPALHVVDDLHAAPAADHDERRAVCLRHGEMLDPLLDHEGGPLPLDC